jgi:hypothetical protein
MRGPVGTPKCCRTGKYSPTQDTSDPLAAGKQPNAFAFRSTRRGGGPNHQRGVAPNAIELHPVLGYRASPVNLAK